MKRILSISTGVALGYLVAGYIFIVMAGQLFRSIEEYENE